MTLGKIGELTSANVFDFHGTLADVRGIHHLLARRDYDGFYEQSLHCPPIESTVAEAQRSAYLGHTNLIFTGMPGRFYGGLRDWLDRHDVPVSGVEMRGEKDRRKAWVLKEEMYLRAVSNSYRILRAWDDDPAVVESWTRLGVPCTRVPGWVEKLTTRRVDNAPVVQ